MTEGTKQADAPGDPAKEVFEHRFRHFIIGDDAILKRTHHLDVFIVNAPEHLARWVAEVDNALFFRQQSDEGRLLQDDTTAVVNQNIHRAQIDAESLTKASHQPFPSLFGRPTGSPRFTLRSTNPAPGPIPEASGRGSFGHGGMQSMLRWRRHYRACVYKHSKAPLLFYSKTINPVCLGSTGCCSHSCDEVQPDAIRARRYPRRECAARGRDCGSSG